MFRFLLLVCFSIGFLAFAESLPACGGDEKSVEALKEKLFEAKKNYDAQMQKLKKSIDETLNKREDTARKAGIKKTVDQVKAEREAFEKESELPSMTPAAIRDPMIAAKNKLDKAFTAVVKEYIRLKMDDAADAAEKERQQFLLESTIMLGKRTYLTTLKHFDVKVHSDNFTINGTAWWGGETIKMKHKGVDASHSIWLHPPAEGFSQVSYPLGGKWTVFRADVGLPLVKEGPDSPQTFEVVADGKSIWKSEPVSKVESYQTCTLNVEKVKTLTLKVHCQGGNRGAWTFWLEPILAE